MGGVNGVGGGVSVLCVPSYYVRVLLWVYIVIDCAHVICANV